uniref:C2H2-type domain-containing protein n=1 Tax=Oryza glumipatula TaxID=40148 RepID=A0A0E0B856_9ORYZ
MSPMRPRSSSASSTSPVAGKKEKTATKPAGGGARDPPKGRSSSFACRVCGKRFPSQQAMAGHCSSHTRSTAAATRITSARQLLPPPPQSSLSPPPPLPVVALTVQLAVLFWRLTPLLAAAAVADWSQVAAGIPLSKEQLVVAVAIVVADDGQGQAAEVFLLDLAAEELNLGPSMNNEATSIPKVRSVYEYFTEAFDLLKEDNVQWCPYMEEETQRRAPANLNTLYLRDSSYWLTKKMIVYDIAVEVYNLQRGDIAEELYSDTTSLWEKLRDNIAGSLEEMMSALDRMRQKCKRIMRRHRAGMHQKSTVPQDTGLRTPYWNNRLPLLGLPHRQDPQLPHVLGRRQGLWHRLR